MKARINYKQTSPDGIKALGGLEHYVHHCDLEPALLELVKTRASQINGCAFCIDMHTKDARANGETEQRLYALNAWRETPFFNERERAALLWTESVTLVSQTQVPDDVYETVRPHFTEKELADLTLAIVAINGWNRLAIAFRAPAGTYQPPTQPKTETEASMSPSTTTPQYEVKLKHRFLVAEETLALQFEKPAGFTFRPGQWIDITLLNPSETDAEGNTRGFSIASSPQEDVLMVATRLRDTAFKRQLPTLPLDTEVKMEGPGGSLTLHNNPERPAVFLVGGIGITPVRSILWHAANTKRSQRIFVFYSNRRPEDAAFLKELTGLQKQNVNYTLIPTMTDMAKSTRPWNGETEQIGAELLAKHLRGVKSPIYYVVGPPRMVNGVHTKLNQIGVDDDDIRSEDFEGY